MHVGRARFLFCKACCGARLRRITLGIIGDEVRLCNCSCCCRIVVNRGSRHGCRSQVDVHLARLAAQMHLGIGIDCAKEAHAALCGEVVTQDVVAIDVDVKAQILERVVHQMCIDEGSMLAHARHSQVVVETGSTYPDVIWPQDDAVASKVVVRSSCQDVCLELVDEHITLKVDELERTINARPS